MLSTFSLKASGHVLSAFIRGPRGGGQRTRPLRLLDVRERFEYEQARIEGADLVPMGTVPSHLDALRADVRPIIVFCHHGMRSLQVVLRLRDQGIGTCRSMSGGIDQWSPEIDAAVARYF